MKSSIIVIFDRFSNHFVESLKLKCCKSVVRNVVVVPKLNEFWLTQEVMCCPILIQLFHFIFIITLYINGLIVKVEFESRIKSRISNPS